MMTVYHALVESVLTFNVAF